jgi:hypothetical protein
MPRVTSVLLRRSANGGVTWTNVRQALYTYWDGSNAFGTLGDLKTAVVQSWQNGVWTNLTTTLYRYYKAPSGSSSSSSSRSSSSSSSSSSSGAASLSSVHMLKYIVEPDSYARLAADPNAGSDPTTAPDWVVALYADNYFEYDAIAASL